MNQAPTPTGGGVSDRDTLFLLYLARNMKRQGVPRGNVPIVPLFLNPYGIYLNLSLFPEIL